MNKQRGKENFGKTPMTMNGERLSCHADGTIAQPRVRVLLDQERDATGCTENIIWPERHQPLTKKALRHFRK